MRLSRRAALATTAAAAFAPKARAGETFSLLLDWFVNPDHAPIFAASYIGAFETAGLAVTITPPTDPDIPPRLVAAGHADMALSYQTQLYLLCDQGVPLRRTGTLIDQPLNTVMSLDPAVKKFVDLKGKKIGYSVAGVEDVLIGAMLEFVGLGLRDVTLVNVNFNLITALISRQVDAVIGGYRNFEEIELTQKGFSPAVFLPEDFGVPPSDELVMMSNAGKLDDPRLPKFLDAVRQGGAALRADPAAMWARFSADQKTLNDALNKAAWFQSVPYFAKNPAYLDVARYGNYRDFMFAKGIIKTKKDVAAYAVQIAT